MPYAIIQTGGKQYRVSQGDRLRVEILPGDVGAQIELTDIRALGEGAGIEVSPASLQGKAVKATVLRHGRGRKIRIWKFKRRKGFSKKQGHRQDFTEIEITEIPAA
jgi:large subunit ribosomal protein L21